MPQAVKPVTPAKPLSISKLLGPAPVLPGESRAHYQASLTALVEELQATTVLQVYLAEKIHECLWWVRRYEAQKRATIVAEMAVIAKGGFTPQVTATEARVRSLLTSGQPEDLDTLAQMLTGIRHTPESLQQKAMASKALALQQLDQQIALQTKILSGLQASYEVAFNRKLHVERLQLQNSLLQRDLQAINLASVESVSPAKPEPHGQP